MDEKTEKISEYIQKRLFENQDLEYRDFQCKLMPTVSSEVVIGVRTPQLRKLATELSKNKEIWEFLKLLPHKYYEENNLHGFLIEKIKDYDTVIVELDKFLPYVDNWATCDLMSPKRFKNHTDSLILKIKEWIASGKAYTIRFGIEMLMKFYLDEKFKVEYAELVCKVRSNEYYVNMMLAWYFATALSKHYDEILPYLENYRLDKWTHNKTIQKAIESYRVTDNQKVYLRSLKIK